MASSFRTTRIVIGVVLLVLVGGLLFLDYRLASRTAVSAVVVVLGLWGYVEYGRIARLGERAAGGGPLAFAWGFLGTAYFLTLAWVEGTCGPAPPEFLVGGVALLVLGCFLGAIARSDFLAVFPRLLACLLGVVLFGLLFSYVLRIYHRGEPKEALLRGLVFFLGVKGTDITAYLVGTAVGRTHFLKVSPGKTLEGSTAALL
ncbi:MAG: phosphatidate cytidylyltransferase, partial [Planctomycetota bacterium]|nr:phosphatidate cytidylyltransferase [Planctomycetota bacterium]